MLEVLDYRTLLSKYCQLPCWVLSSLMELLRIHLIAFIKPASADTLQCSEIQQEIKPFKKELLETNITFENVVKKLDLLEAERISIRDSLSLLESRYK